MVRQVLALDEENPTPVHRLAYACAEDPAHAPPPTLLEETLPRHAVPTFNIAGRGEAGRVELRGDANPKSGDL